MSRCEKPIQQKEEKLTEKSNAEETSELTLLIKNEATRIGFDMVGITPAVTPLGIGALQKWLDQGFAGKMSYIERRKEAYANPQLVMENVQTVIALAINYKTEPPLQTKPGEGRVARYAWGEVDYHNHIRKMLRTLGDYIQTIKPNCKTRGTVDTAPILERDFARQAGLGWFGKNTMLINKKKGSFLFLAALLVDFKLPADQPHSTSHCGTCTRCLDVCPTNAFVEPYVLDARKCISYLTIELRDEPIPTPLRSGMQDWLFGCDLCQDVCPWNRKPSTTEEPVFQPTADLNPIDASQLLQMNETEFKQRFRKSPLNRPKRAGLLRNAAIVLGNTKSIQFIALLSHTLKTESEPLIRGAAAWALGNIGTTNALNSLKAEQKEETDKDVLQEINNAINKSSED